jgi:hypothetical protein
MGEANPKARPFPTAVIPVSRNAKTGTHDLRGDWLMVAAPLRLSATRRSWIPDKRCALSGMTRSEKVKAGIHFGCWIALKPMADANWPAWT